MHAYILSLVYHDIILCLTLALHSLQCHAYYRISQAVQVTDSCSDSSIIVITSKGEYIFRQGYSEIFMRPVQETNPSVSAELVL